MFKSREVRQMWQKDPCYFFIVVIFYISPRRLHFIKNYTEPKFYEIHIGGIQEPTPYSKVHGANMGPVGPRWAPCWPQESCYQGLSDVHIYICTSFAYLSAIYLTMGMNIHWIWIMIHKSLIQWVLKQNSKTQVIINSTTWLQWVYLYLLHNTNQVTLYGQNFKHGQFSNIHVFHPSHHQQSKLPWLEP